MDMGQDGSVAWEDQYTIRGKGDKRKGDGQVSLCEAAKNGFCELFDLCDG